MEYGGGMGGGGDFGGAGLYPAWLPARLDAEFGGGGGAYAGAAGCVMTMSSTGDSGSIRREIHG